MKRTSRSLSEETKHKISQALKNRPKSEEHKQALSIALKKYWLSLMQYVLSKGENVASREHKTTFWNIENKRLIR